MIPFEEENVRAYRLLLWIEVTARECIRYCMAQRHGETWRKHIPGPLLKKVRDSEMEENRPHFDYIRLGPLYYLTLGEIVPMLSQKVSKDIVELFGGEWIIEDIKKILGPRNAICHARPVPSAGISAIETLHKQMTIALQSHQLEHVVTSPDTGVSPDDTSKALIPWLDGLVPRFAALQSPLEIHDMYESAILQYWWGTQELAGFNCEAVESLIKFIHQYNSLPQGLGSARKRQLLCENKQPSQLIETAIKELKRVSP